MKRVLILIFLFMVTAEMIRAGQGNTQDKRIEAVGMNEKITIDGILSENIWKRPGFTDIWQQEPNEGAPPTQRSEIWVNYDDEAIYFAAKYYDTHPDSIFARLVRRDFIWGDPSDGCVLYIDPYRDKRSGYFFYVSAAGALADGVIENDVKQPNDLTWDAVWEGAAHIDSDGWSVEMKIPFSQLRFNPNTSQTWGINAERFISRTAETDMVAYTPRNESGFASRFPALVGLEGIKPPARLEILPYTTGKAEYIGSDPGDPFNSGHKYSPGFGFDLKTGIGNGVTFNATVNPDFGQVEVDPAVVNLSDVEVTFDEKRPFFTEGVSIFRFGQGGTNNTPTFNWTTPSIFYSRRIGHTPYGIMNDYDYDYADVSSGTHILGAGKISGQVLDDWKIGMIHAVTQREMADISYNGVRSTVEAEPLTYYGIFRIQKDFSQGQQGFGLLSTYTNRLFKDNLFQKYLNKDALIIALDGWMFLDAERTYVVSGWAAGSRVAGDQKRMISLQRSSLHYFQRPDADYIDVDSNATSLSGYAGRFMLNKNRGRWTFNATVGALSPKFEVNDLGYSSYSDLVNAHFYTSYRWNTPTSVYQQAGINAATYANYDFGGNKTAQGFWMGTYITFLNLSGGNINYTYSPTSYNARRTRGGPLTLNPISRSTNINLFSDNREWWVLNLGSSLKKSDDYSYAIFNMSVEFKVTPNLTLTVGPQLSREFYAAQWISNQNAWANAYLDATATGTFGRRYVFANLNNTTFSADMRMDWIISPQLSLQLYLQPLASSGSYSSFKTLTRAGSFDFLKYGENGSSIRESISSDGAKSYTLDPDGAGPAVAKTLENPDFNFVSLRGNAVLRWEYRAGSAVYLVWTQSRAGDEELSDFQFGSSMRNLFTVRPDNIFMVKLTYWLGM